MEDQEIDALIQTLNSSKDFLSLFCAVQRLGRIATGNPKVIAALIQLLDTTKDEDTRWRVAAILREIATGNPKVIAALIQLLDTTKDDYTRREVAAILGEIDPGNPKVIAALIQLLDTTKDEDTRWRVAAILGEIDPGNPKAIAVLIQLLDTTKDKDTRWRLAEILGEIDLGNPKAIAALIQLLDTTKDEDTRWRLAVILGKIAPGNSKAITALIQLLDTNKDDYTRREVAEILGKIDPGNPKAIAALIQLLDTNKDDYTRRKVAAILGKIDPGNPRAITVLIQLLDTNKDDYTRRKVAAILGKIATGNSQVIEKVLNILRINKKVQVEKLIVDILGEIAVGNATAIAGLRELIQTTQSALTRSRLIEVLAKIDTITDWKTEQFEDELQLFLQTTRIKETADRYLYLNHDQKAKFCYHRIIACLERLQVGKDIITRRTLMESYLNLYQKIVNFAIKTQDFKTAFFYAQIFRNRYLVERITQYDTPLPKTLDRELTKSIEQAKKIECKTLINYTDALLQNLPKPEIDQLSQQWETAKQKLEQLYQQVALTEPEFIAKTQVYPISFDEVQTLLPSDTAIIDFFFTENRLITQIILPQTSDPIVPPELYLEFQTNPLKSLAEAWVNDISGKHYSEKDKSRIEALDVQGRIEKLSAFLNFSQLENYIPKTIKHLILVPNTYLHLFPLHALLINDNQPLINRFSVQYYPNLLLWKICQQRQRPQQNFIAVENPTQDENLIFAQAEVASIIQCSKFQKTHIINGENALKSDILKRAQDNHYFHFSGHAEYNFKNPLNSYLMLSKNHQDNLTLNTILAEMQMSCADLVTLSACCTGVVDGLQPTDEHLGIATGFLLAGAKAIVGSLWQVNSISTAFLLDEFYRQFDAVGNKAIALQNAQNWLRCCTAENLRERANTWDLSVLGSTDRFILNQAVNRLEGIPIPFQNPYYWSAFILVGC
jgi:CHAT domain-containing protein/HEAT repeat protein